MTGMQLGHPFFASGLAAFILMAGCADSGSTGTPNSPGDPEVVAPRPATGDVGRLEGTVTDDSLNPIEGVELVILEKEMSTLSDANGVFSFSEVPAGEVDVAAQRVGYHSTVRKVTIIAGDVAALALILQGLPTAEPYHVTQQEAGVIGCGIDAHLPTYRVGNPNACSLVYGTPAEIADKARVDFQLTALNTSLLQTLVFETEWTPNNALVYGLIVNWMNFQDLGPGGTFVEPVRSFAHVRGESPLHNISINEKIMEVTTAEPQLEYCPLHGTCKIWAFTYPHRGYFGPESELDVGIYVDQRFTHYVTEFFVEPAPAFFSVLEDA